MPNYTGASKTTINDLATVEEDLFAQLSSTDDEEHSIDFAMNNSDQKKTSALKRKANSTLEVEETMHQVIYEPRNKREGK